MHLVNKITSLLLALIFILPIPGNCINEDVFFDDWITNPQNKLCHGFYQEPQYQFPGLTGKIPQQPLNIEADQAHLEPNGTSIFRGNVITREGNQTLKSEQLKIIKNPKNNKIQNIYANGKVTITEPGIRIDGSSAELLYKQDMRIINDANYRLYTKHGRGYSKQITTLNSTNMTLRDGSYTTCAPDSNLWHIKAKQVKFNQETGRGQAWHSYLYLKNIPVFYWPYLNFPIDDRRATGFLQPWLEKSSKSGLVIFTPFYWNLAPNYDATLTPQYMSKRGFKFDNEFRYLTRRSQGNFQFNFLPNDRGYHAFRARKLRENTFAPSDFRVLNLKDIHQRYFITAIHKTNLNKNWDFAIDYSRAGDDNYLYDFPNTLSTSTIIPSTYGRRYENQSTTHLLQQASLNYKNQYGNILTKLSQYQTLHPFDGPAADEQYRSLPNISGQFSHTINYKTNLDLKADYTNFKFKQNKSTSPRTIGKRFHTRPAISRSLIDQPGIFLRPRMQINHITYNTQLALDDQAKGKKANPSSTIPLFDLDSGLVFERDLIINNSSMLQTLEPRAYFLYVPYKNQIKNPLFDSGFNTFDYAQLFRDNRYTGFDRVSEAKQISLGLMSRFENTAGVEKASIGVGRILYMQDRRNNGIAEPLDNSSRLSPIAAIAKYQINPRWSIEANIVQNKLFKSFSESILARYTVANDKVINFGYQFQKIAGINPRNNRSNNTKQTQLSLGWRISPNIGLLGKLDYDWQQSRAMKILSGLEIHSCCTIVRVVWFKFLNSTDNTQIWKKYDHTLGLQLVFKGLGSDLGNISYRKFISEIPGYIPHDDEF